MQSFMRRHSQMNAVSTDENWMKFAHLKRMPEDSRIFCMEQVYFIGAKRTCSLCSHLVLRKIRRQSKEWRYAQRNTSCIITISLRFQLEKLDARGILTDVLSVTARLPKRRYFLLFHPLKNFHIPCVSSPNRLPQTVQHQWQACAPEHLRLWTAAYL